MKKPILLILILSRCCLKALTKQASTVSCVRLTEVHDRTQECQSFFIGKMLIITVFQTIIDYTAGILTRMYNQERLYERISSITNLVEVVRDVHDEAALISTALAHATARL